MEEIEVSEEPLKIKKPRSEKQILAFTKAREKKAELAQINKEFNNVTKKQKEEIVEHKKRIIKTIKEPVEVEVEVEPEVNVAKVKKQKRSLFKLKAKAKRKR